MHIFNVNNYKQTNYKQMENKYCFCKGCKYPQSHITSYHKCGKCHQFGHGFVECHLNNNGLYHHINNLYDKAKNQTNFPKHKYCTISDCKTKFTHDTNSHDSFFSLDEFGSYDGPDKYGIRKRRATIEKNKKLIENKLNTYISMYWGMGITIIFRNKNGIIEKLETEETRGNTAKEFVKGLIKIKDPR